MANSPPVRRGEPNHLKCSKVYLHNLVHDEPSGPSSVEGNGEEDGSKEDDEAGPQCREYNSDLPPVP